MPTVLPVVKTIDNPPYMRGRRVSWTLKAGEDGDAQFVPPYKRLAVAISGDHAGATVSFTGVLADEAPSDIYSDVSTPFMLRKPGVYEIPIAVSRIAPVIKGGTDETQITITIFISEGV